MTAADTLPAIQRPDGRLYRPRKVVAHSFSDDLDFISGVIVTGTHDRDRALKVAQELIDVHLGTGYRPVWSGNGWWRDGMENGQRCWVADDERGQAGVLFGKIEEVAFSG